MQKTRIIPLTADLALTAADISLSEKLAMADAIMLAAARAHDADLLTTDEDFAGRPGARVLPRSGRS
jgi:predicted nucleic acid-binding protein